MKAAKVLRMPGPVRAPRTAHLPYAVQAAPGAVAVVLPAPLPGETAHWITPDQAYELALELLDAARAGARQALRTEHG